MSRLLKKYSHKYEFLKLEFEDFEQEFEIHETNWKDIFGEYFNNIKTEVWVNEETGEIRDSPPDENSKDKKPQKEEKVKKLYRKASRIAHPDKGGNVEDFNYVKKCYEENDLLGLINYASQNNIPIEVSEEDEQLLENSCKKYQEKMENMQFTREKVILAISKLKHVQESLWFNHDNEFGDIKKRYLEEIYLIYNESNSELERHIKFNDHHKFYKMYQKRPQKKESKNIIYS